MDQVRTNTAGREQLASFIDAESETLLRTLRLYLLRAGLPAGEDATQAATELLSEVTVEALAHADRFRAGGQPMAWLLGIAANLIKRRQSRFAKDRRREPLVRDMMSRHQALLSEDELFNQLAAARTPDPAQAVAAQDHVREMLSHASERDRRVIRLAVLHDLSGKQVAAELGITPGAARVRLHRALNRLREALSKAGGLEG